MEERLLEIFAEILDVDVEELSIDSTRDEIEEWDSLAMVELVGEIEHEFDCRIPFEEIEKCEAIKDFLKYL